MHNSKECERCQRDLILYGNAFFYSDTDEHLDTPRIVMLKTVNVNDEAVGPWGTEIHICEVPRQPDLFPVGYGFKCLTCGAQYIRRRAVKERWWRNWSAPDGYWARCS